MNEYGLSLSHCIDPFPVEPHRLLLATSAPEHEETHAQQGP